MTVAYRSLSSAAQAGVDVLTYRHPVTLESGDKILFFVARKYSGATLTAPTGLTLLREQLGGSGLSAGADTGEVIAGCYSAISAGTEDAGTEVIAHTSGNSITSRSIAYSRGGTAWDVAHTYAAQDTAADTWTIDSAAQIDLAVGDVVVVAVASNSDADYLQSVTLTAPSVTFSSMVQRQEPTGTTQGDDCMLSIYEWTVSSGGNSSATLSFTNDNGGGAGDPAGAVLFVRLRETSGGGGGSIAPISHYYQMMRSA